MSSGFSVCLVAVAKGPNVAAGPFNANHDATSGTPPMQSTAACIRMPLTLAVDYPSLATHPPHTPHKEKHGSTVAIATELTSQLRACRSLDRGRRERRLPLSLSYLALSPLPLTRHAAHTPQAAPTRASPARKIGTHGSFFLLLISSCFSCQLVAADSVVAAANSDCMAASSCAAVGRSSASRLRHCITTP